MCDSSVTSVQVEVEDWRSESPTVVSRTSFLFNSPELSDVQFIFTRNGDREETTIYGHKLILAMASPVFNKIFFGQNQQFATTVETRMDMNPHTFSSEAFLTFIKFLYMDKINYAGLSVEIIVGILECADYYDIPYLKNDCTKELEKILTTRNVIQVLETAVLFREGDLSLKALEFIDHNARCVFESEEILCAKLETLVSILEGDFLDIDECFVLDLALKWAEHECSQQHLEPTVGNKRNVLGDAFLEIRFALLTTDRISKIVSSGLLTLKESVEVLLAVHKPQSSKFQRISPEVSFKSNPRVFGKKLELIEIRKMKAKWTEANKLVYWKSLAKQANLCMRGFHRDATEEDVKHSIQESGFGTDLRVYKIRGYPGVFHVRFLYNPSFHSQTNLLDPRYYSRVDNTIHIADWIQR